MRDGAAASCRAGPRLTPRRSENAARRAPLRAFPARARLLAPLVIVAAARPGVATAARAGSVTVNGVTLTCPDSVVEGETLTCTTDKDLPITGSVSRTAMSTFPLATHHVPPTPTAMFTSPPRGATITYTPGSQVCNVFQALGTRTVTVETNNDSHTDDPRHFFVYLRRHGGAFPPLDSQKIQVDLLDNDSLPPPQNVVVAPGSGEGSVTWEPPLTYTERTVDHYRIEIRLLEGNSVVQSWAILTGGAAIRLLHA